MRSHGLLTHGPEGEPLWVCLYVQQVSGMWATMIVAEDDPRRCPANSRGGAFSPTRPPWPQSWRCGPWRSPGSKAEIGG